MAWVLLNKAPPTSSIKSQIPAKLAGIFLSKLLLDLEYTPAPTNVSANKNGLEMYIGELAQSTNTTIDTLRYYEKIGLIKNVPRDSGGRRVYNQSFVAWVEFIKVLKSTGMPLRDMLAYAEHRQKGPSSNKDRHDLLVAHEQRIQKALAEQQKCLHLVRSKINAYAGAIAQGADIPISVCNSDDFKQ